LLELRSARSEPGTARSALRDTGEKLELWRHVGETAGQHHERMHQLSEASEGRRNRPTRVLVLSTAAFTLLFAVWLMLGVLGVPIKKELRLETIEFTWLAAIAVLSGSLFRLPFGIITDRFGGRSVMSLLLLATAVPCYLVSQATTYPELLICAFLFGVGGNSFSVGIAWNAAWFEKERQGFALGTFGAGNVGASITKLIGPAMIAALSGPALLGGAIPGGWRAVPILYSVLLVIMALATFCFSPTPDRRPGKSRALASMLSPLREARVWRFGLYYVVVFGAYVAFSLWLPSYYQRVYTVSLGTASLLTALFIFPASLLRPLGGWLSDRYGARAVTYGVFIAMLLACLPLCLANLSGGEALGLAPFFLCVEVLGIGMGIGKASVYKYIPEYFPADVGAVGGLVGTLGALGGFFLPLGFGYLEAASGRPESCFWVMSLLIAWSFLWLHGVVTRIRRTQSSVPPAVTPMPSGTASGAT
jgi:MFS transporter, NNP family, nitrate/nitrite transporter